VGREKGKEGMGRQGIGGDGWGCDMLELVNRDRVRSTWCFNAILTEDSEGRRWQMGDRMEEG
jgi:hypothetical protein